MIKFFRHIRKSLLEQNKMSKYFKYAVGEILLVVMGILIALQINNWNEQRKTKQDEILILTQLNSDLKKNLEEIEEIKDLINVSAINSERLLKFLSSKSTTTDSMGIWLKKMDKNPIFNNANTAYKNIENSSNNIISNDSLRMRITLMYEKEFRNIHIREDFYLRLHLPAFKEQQRENFKLTMELSENKKETIYSYHRPIDIVKLKNNELYKNALVDVYNFRKLRLRFLTMTTGRLQTLIRDIDQEIETLK